MGGQSSEICVQDSVNDDSSQLKLLYKILKCESNLLELMRQILSDTTVAGLHGKESTVTEEQSKKCNSYRDEGS